MNESQNDLEVWKGLNYETGGILIVGESTYARPGVDTSQYNVLMARDHMVGRGDRFRTKLVRAFLGRDDETPGDITAFWHSGRILQLHQGSACWAASPPQHHDVGDDARRYTRALGKLASCPIGCARVPDVGEVENLAAMRDGAWPFDSWR